MISAVAALALSFLYWLFLVQRIEDQRPQPWTIPALISGVVVIIPLASFIAIRNFFAVDAHIITYCLGGTTLFFCVECMLRIRHYWTRRS